MKSKQNALKTTASHFIFKHVTVFISTIFSNNFMKQAICLFIADRPISVIVCILFMKHLSAKRVGNE